MLRVLARVQFDHADLTVNTLLGLGAQMNLSGLGLIGMGIARIAYADSLLNNSRIRFVFHACRSWSMSCETMRWEEDISSVLGIGLKP